MLIRIENPADNLFIDALLRDAFETEAEAGLVTSLREGSHVTLSLVACDEEGKVVGHVAFSPVTVGGVDCNWQGLGPLAVAPEYQRQGIAHRLIREGLATLKELGYPAVVVLGDPIHYASAGFKTAAEFGLDCRWPVPAEYFMVCDLAPEQLNTFTGRVEYAQPFNDLG